MENQSPIRPIGQIDNDEELLRYFLSRGGKEEDFPLFKKARDEAFSSSPRWNDGESDSDWEYLQEQEFSY